MTAETESQDRAVWQSDPADDQSQTVFGRGAIAISFVVALAAFSADAASGQQTTNIVKHHAKAVQSVMAPHLALASEWSGNSADEQANVRQKITGLAQDVVDNNRRVRGQISIAP